MTKKDELYEQLLKEKERVIIVLTDFNDHLRQELAYRPFTTINRSDEKTLELKPEELEMDMQAWVSEEEFDLKELVESGKLSAEEAEAAFAEISEIDFHG